MLCLRSQEPSPALFLQSAAASWIWPSIWAETSSSEVQSHETVGGTAATAATATAAATTATTAAAEISEEEEAPTATSPARDG